MTVKEFEAWVSDHYEDLVQLAGRVTQNHDRSVELLHESVEAVLSDPSWLPDDTPTSETLLEWFGIDMKMNHLDAIDHDVQQDGLKQRFAASLASLGQEDTFMDPTRLKKSLTFQRWSRGSTPSKSQRKAKLQSTKSEQLLAPSDWLCGQSGNVRWRYQQLRDDRLFASRAIRSQADSIWGAVKRQVHGIERGNSYTEFGQEPAMGRQEVSK